ncbi:MAG: tetraacyldisaccharide 4'-kinase [Cryomorphaceae bacterium]
MKKIRLAFLPFSWFYALIVWIRNKLYDLGIFKSRKVGVKTVVVGNIALGGTGKTPHIEYILDLLKGENLAVLSRGYGRETKGTALVSGQSQTGDVGDEPLQIALKFPEIPVVVDEDRLRGIAFIRQRYPEVKAIILDDALQHRKLKGGLNILLTTFENPFFRDFYLPAGNLRDHKIRARDADAILVTKCPGSISTSKMKHFNRRLTPYCKTIFYNRIKYLPVKQLSGKPNTPIESFRQVALITGIAIPNIFLARARESFSIMKHFKFRDHHPFTRGDMERFKSFSKDGGDQKIALLTTEKDAMRLRSVMNKSEMENIAIYFWEIGLDWIDGKSKFDQLILNYIHE